MSKIRYNNIRQWLQTYTTAYWLVLDWLNESYTPTPNLMYVTKFFLFVLMLLWATHTHRQKQWRALKRHFNLLLFSDFWFVLNSSDFFYFRYSIRVDCFCNFESHNFYQKIQNIFKGSLKIFYSKMEKIKKLNNSC